MRGGAAKPPAVAAPAAESRRHSLRPSRTALVLTSLAFCRGRRDDAVHAYSSLPLEEPPAKGAHVSVDFDFRALPGEEDAKRGLKAALEDAAPARRCASFNASSPPPAAKEAEVRALPGFDQGIMSGLRGIVAAEPSRSPERENPTTPKASEEEAAAAAFDDMGTPAARDIPEVTGFVRARVDEFHEKIEKKKKAAKAADEEALDVAPPPPRRPERVTKASAVVVVYFTSLRGVRRTFEDAAPCAPSCAATACASTSATCPCTPPSGRSSAASSAMASPGHHRSRACSSATAATTSARRRSARAPRGRRARPRAGRGRVRAARRRRRRRRVRGLRRHAVPAMRDVLRQLQGLRRRRRRRHVLAMPGLQRERAHQVPGLLLLIATPPLVFDRFQGRARAIGWMEL